MLMPLQTAGHLSTYVGACALGLAARGTIDAASGPTPPAARLANAGFLLGGLGALGAGAVTLVGARGGATTAREAIAAFPKGRATMAIVAASVLAGAALVTAGAVISNNQQQH